jgi:transposase-like protein
MALALSARKQEHTVPKQPSPMPELQVAPDPKLEKRTRRTFKPEYKLRIIQEADACKHGELGALLRREKIYSNQLSEWRREYAENGLAGLSKSSPGPAPVRSSEQREIESLKQQVLKLNRKLDMANDCLDIQKKVLSILDRSSSGNTP